MVSRRLFQKISPWLLLILFLGGCKKDPPQPEVIFSPLGLEVYNSAPKNSLKLRDSRGKLLLSYPALSSPNVLMIYPWKTGSFYQLKVGKKSFRIQAPLKRPLAEIEVFAPLGSPGERIFLAPGKTLFRPLTVFSARDCFEVGFLITSFVPSLSIREEGPLSGPEPRVLLGEMDRILMRKTLCLPGGEKQGFPLEFLAPEGRGKISFSFRREFFDISQKISLKAWELPTDEYGLRLKVQKEGLLVLPNPFFEKLGYLLGLKNRGYSRYEPFAFESITLKNQSPVPVNLLLKADFLDPASRKPLREFYPPRFGMRGHYRKPLAFLFLPPFGEGKALLPIYAEGVKPGQYLARISVYLWGEKTPFLVKERLLGVTQGKTYLISGLILVLCGGMGYSLFILLRLKGLLHKFSLRELSLIALTGAVSFGLDFLGGVVSNILHLLLGPFNILAGGLITEIVHYTVFTAVFVLVPKPGFATLSGLLHYLMGLFLFGGVRATDPFFLGFSLLTLEAFLILFRSYQKPASLRTVWALSLADAINTVSSLILHMTFYRLFFPTWYLGLSVGIKGFLYTFGGCLLGLRVGKYLRKIER